MTSLTLTADDVTQLETRATGWHNATGSANCDLWLAAGNELDDHVQRLLDRFRAANAAANVAAPPPSFPHAIGNPYEVYVRMEPGSPEAVRHQDGQVGIACESIEHVDVMFDAEQLTRAFPWWVQAIVVERTDGGRPARVIAEKTRDLTVTTRRWPQVTRTTAASGI